MLLDEGWERKGEGPEDICREAALAGAAGELLGAVVESSALGEIVEQVVGGSLRTWSDDMKLRRAEAEGSAAQVGYGVLPVLEAGCDLGKEEIAVSEVGVSG